jgi:hypothetical protein
MTESLKLNAYHVLGLDGSSSTKRIVQRQNEIVQRLKIDDLPKYILDVSAFKEFRNEKVVKDAVRKLQAPRSQVREYFFWFHFGDNIDKEAAVLHIKGNYKNAAQIWANATTADSNSNFRYRRNLSISSTIALINTRDISFLDKSLESWKGIIGSSAFWSSFAEAYEGASGQPIAMDAFNEFQAGVSGDLSDIYSEIQDLHGTDKYIYEFRNYFAAKGDRIEKDILRPAYQTIDAAIESLSEIHIDEREPFNKTKSKKVKSAIENVQSALQGVIAAGLYDDSDVRVVRDKVAVAIRRIVLDVHNHQNEFKTAYKLLEIALRIAGTDSLKAQLSSELEQIQHGIDAYESNTLTLEVPGALNGGTVIFKGDHVIYGKQKILYRDAISISYGATNTSINLIPISQSYSYMVASEDERIELSFGSALYIGNKKKQDTWMTLAGVSQQFIEPHIVEKLIKRIFVDDEQVSIGGITFDRNGYSQSRFFGGTDTVPWTEVGYIPQLSSGNIVLWKTRNGKAVAFATIPMSTSNAVVVPNLVKACIQRVLANVRK